MQVPLTKPRTSPLLHPTSKHERIVHNIHCKSLLNLELQASSEQSNELLRKLVVSDATSCVGDEVSWPEIHQPELRCSSIFSVQCVSAMDHVSASS
jgi:hypothetical protein